MTGYGFFRALRFLLALGLMVVAALVGLVAFIVTELQKEARYRHNFGQDWQEAFEKDYGSLAGAHTRIGVAIFGIVAICCLSVWLYRILTADRSSGQRSGSRRSRRKHHWFGGPEHYRRNALVAVLVGVGGILAGVFLSLFRIGIFGHHDDELALGIFVACGGYCSVIAGCRWWLKAKESNEAIVLIGFLPVAILFVPFVRLVFVRLIFTTPLLLPAIMIMMPLILVVVVAVLPDKAAPRQRSRRYDD